MVNRVFPIQSARRKHVNNVTKLGPGKIIIVFMCKVFSTLVLSYFRRIAVYIYYTEMIAFHFSFLFICLLIVVLLLVVDISIHLL